jgi:hypothetical protein
MGLKQCSRYGKDCSSLSQYQPLSAFSKNATVTDRLSSQCKECVKPRSTAWRKNNPEQFKTSMAAWYRNNTETQLAKRIFYTYKRTPEDTAEQAALQSNLCAICQDAPPTEWDHWHHGDWENDGTCGECVRGLLCRSCNSSLRNLEHGMRGFTQGKFSSPLALKSALEYIDYWNAVIAERLGLVAA